MNEPRKVGMLKNYKIEDSEIKMSKDNYNMLYKLLGNFCSQTSISGISNAGAANSYFRKGCWLFVFVVFTIFTVIGFGEVIKDYMTYPVTTSIYVQDHNRVFMIELI